MARPAPAALAARLAAIAAATNDINAKRRKPMRDPILMEFCLIMIVTAPASAVNGLF